MEAANSPGCAQVHHLQLATEIQICCINPFSFTLNSIHNTISLQSERQQISVVILKKML